MKIVFISIIFLLPILLEAAMPPGWKSITSFGVEEAYQYKDNTSNIFTVVKKKDNDNFSIKDFKLDIYVNNLGESRDFIHKLVGISKWTITSSEKIEYFNGKTKVLLVKLKGHYLRKEKIEVEFEEWHHFYGTTFLQLQLIRNKTQMTNNDVDFFSEMQKKWL